MGCFGAQITNTDMARVLTMIEGSCPNALSKKVSTDEVLVNFDALTPRCFHEVNAFVLACFLNLSGNKKGKKRKAEGASSSAGGEAGNAGGESSSKAAGSSGAAQEGEGEGEGEAGVESKGNDGEEAEF
jgi:hypothetical protein